MKRKLIIKKSFSKVDNGYIQLFKHRRKLPALTGDYKIKDLVDMKNNRNKLIEVDKNTDSTSAKLDIIISNLQQSNSYLTKQFLEEITLQNENNDLRKRMQVLYRRRKLKEKKINTEKVKKNDHIDGTKEAIQHMLYFAKKYAVNKELVRIKTEQNNKKPPICRYTPSLDYISKHIPSVYFGYHKTIKDKEKINENIKVKNSNKNEENKNSNNNSNNNSIIKINEENNENILGNNNKLMITENDNSKTINSNMNTINNNSTIKERHKIKIYKNILKKPNKETKKTLLEKVIVKSEKDTNNIITNLTKGIFNTINAQRRTLIKRNIPTNLKLNQNKIRYNISVPIFNKMTSRENSYPLINRNKNMADYNPNYDSIYPRSYKYNSVNEKMKKKKYKLRKILGSYNPNGEYVLLPILNKS